MSHVGRFIIVSRELDLDALHRIHRSEMPSDDLFRWYVIWDYDNANVDEKYAKGEVATLSLLDIVIEGEKSQPGECPERPYADDNQT